MATTIRKINFDESVKPNRGIKTGSLVEAGLHTVKRNVLTPGKSYTVDELIAGNGIERKKQSFSIQL